MPDDLPFELRTKLADRRGTLHFIAERDGEQLALTRYAPGDTKKRQATARQWATDPLLRNGQLLSVATITKKLEEAELAALPIIEDELSQDDDAAIGDPISSYFDDQQIIELAWSVELGRPDLIRYDRQFQTINRAPSIEMDGVSFCPPRCAASICTPGGSIPGAVLLPTESDEAGLDEDKLREDIHSFVHRYVELSDAAESLVVEYVALSWLHDGFDEVPYLAFKTSDVGRGKSRALETVGTLCYRPILCGGGSSAAATLRLIDTFGGTLLGDEYDQKASDLAAELTRIANQGFQRNRPLIRCVGEHNEPKPFRCFGPKVFALRKGFSDDATESRIISIRMRQRTRADVPINLPRAQFDCESLGLRNRLLSYRFARLGQIKINPEDADPRVEDRLNQIGLPLCAVAGDRGRHIVIDALLEQQTILAADRGDSLPGEILHAILQLAKPGGSVHPGDVANKINSQRAEAQGLEVDRLPKGERISSNKAGWILKVVLELPRERDRTGTSYKLDEARIGQLCQRFGVTPENLPHLQHCHAPHTLPRENTLFEAENADCGKCDNGGNVTGMPGDGDNHCHNTDPQSNIPAGWSPGSWASRLDELADKCEAEHPDESANYRRQAAKIRTTLETVNCDDDTDD